jgi:uncharacterized RDD family membrane protein YckC
VNLLTLAAPPTDTVVVPYADFSDRVVAKVLDVALLGICLLPLDIVFDTSFLDALHRTRTEGLIVFALFCLYSAVLESSKQQATWGKRAMGIIVNDVDGNRISFARALLRAVMQYTGTGFLFAPFTPRRQALHDLVAKTVVTPGTL